LCSRIIKLTGLSDNNGAGADNENWFDWGVFWHFFFLTPWAGAEVNAICIPGSKTKGIEGNVKEYYEWLLISVSLWNSKWETPSMINNFTIPANELPGKHRIKEEKNKCWKGYQTQNKDNDGGHHRFFIIILYPVPVHSHRNQKGAKYSDEDSHVPGLKRFYRLWFLNFPVGEGILVVINVFLLWSQIDNKLI